MGAGWGQGSGPAGPSVMEPVAHQGTQVLGSEALRRSGGDSSGVLPLPGLCLFRTLWRPLSCSPLSWLCLNPFPTRVLPSFLSLAALPCLLPSLCYPGRVKLDALPALQTVWNSLNALTLGLYRMAERQFTG